MAFYLKGEIEMKKVVVFFHGLWATSRVFEGLVNFLKAHSVRSHGSALSRTEREKFQAYDWNYFDFACQRPGTLREWYCDVQSYLDQVRRMNPYHQLILIGHSLGGLMVAKVAPCYSDILDKLVLIAPAAPKDIFRTSWPQLCCMVKMLPRILTCGSTGIVDCKSVYENFSRIDLGNYAQDNGRILRDLIFKNLSLDWQALKKIHGVILGGTKDKMVPFAIAKKYAERTGFELVAFDGLGHEILDEPIVRSALKEKIFQEE